MKELSIEEKAKAYDKAIEKAKWLADNPFAGYDGIDLISALFPELKESEDEKIRKDLIIYLRSVLSNKKYGDKFIESWIAWLEKQGEQKPVADFSDLRTWKYIVDAVLTEKEGIGQYLDSLVTEEVAKKLQKRFGNIEQKLADKVEPKFKIGDTVKDPYGDLYHITEIIDDSYKTDDGRFILFKNQEVYTLSNFTAWSEEDKKMFEKTIYRLQEWNAWKHSQGYQNETGKTPIEWLKSLKDRVQSQNLTVTEEELAQAKKDAYNDVLDKIEYHSGEPTFDDGWSAAIWYLKKRNAQPQNTWKPSDEQMLAINTAINVCGKGTINGKYLVALHEQLLKLREE